MVQKAIVMPFRQSNLPEGVFCEKSGIKAMILMDCSFWQSTEKEVRCLMDIIPVIIVVILSIFVASKIYRAIAESNMSDGAKKLWLWPFHNYFMDKYGGSSFKCKICGCGISMREIERVGRYVKDENHHYYHGCCSEKCLQKMRNE